MLVYFDTNVYSHISEAESEQEVKSAIKRLGWEIIASADNLFEMYAIRNAARREREVATLTSVARRFDKVPHSYREAMEVRQAISAQRPSWIRRVVFDRFSRDRRADHIRRWNDAKCGVFPSSTAYEAYRRDIEAGIAQTLAFQRELRQRKVRQEAAIIVKEFGDKFGAIRTDLEQPEAFCRAECWFAYNGALVHRNPATRDLYDWLAPHLKMHLVTTEELFLLWLRDVNPAEAVISSWSGLVGWGQLHSKTSHGNANDQQHAAMALVADLFVTADVGFHKALRLAAPNHVGNVAKLALWPRSAPEWTHSAV
jgi:hypothetical protein